MTRLKELRLHGFKTFAEPTVFAFERGVTAVIGPNGSGKSNMADAVRWVLGEQSNRSLRTRRADDVIFAGSQGRRPQGLAEVTLTLDNSSGWLPIDYGEVSIGRRSYRSGETEYLINGARARLKEVIDLLAGGRLGANELVVVGQGTVDAALSLRPDERRQLFEEAAGVKNLQVRKNEALARLARARDNLSRVGDLIGELRPQVRRLALQAQHQEEHDAVGCRARLLVVEAHRRQESQARTALGEARRRAAAAEAGLEALRSEEAAGRAAIADAEAGYWAAEAAARHAAERREGSREVVIRAEARADSIARRQAELGAAIARAEADLAAALAVLQSPQADPDAGSDDRWTAAADAEHHWQEAVAGLAEADRRSIAAQESLAAGRAAAAASIAREREHEEWLARAQARQDRVEYELAAAAEAVHDASQMMEAARLAFAGAESVEADTLGALAAARRGLDDAEPRANAARQHATGLAERVGVLQAELERLRERAEGSGQLGARLTGAGWHALLDVIDPPPEAWSAVEAVVGGEVQQALVWHEADLLTHLVDARGMARLVLGGETQDADGAASGRAEALAAVGATRTLADWIGAANGPLLFARAVLAPDLASLLRGWRRLPPGWFAVTAAGDLADGRGLLTVHGRADEGAGEASRQQVRRRELVATLQQLGEEHAAAAQVAARALVALTEARGAVDAAVAAHAGTQRETEGARDAFERSAQAAKRSAGLEAVLTDELDQVRAARPLAAPTVDGTPSPVPQLDQLGAAVAEADRRRALAAEEWDRARAACQEAQAAVTGAGPAGGARRGERAVLLARRDQLSAALAADREALDAVDAERATVDAARAAAVAIDREIADERGAVEQERDRLRGELLERERTRGGAVAHLAELERETQAAAIEAQRLGDTLAAIGRERDLALESLPLQGSDAPSSEAPVGEPDPGLAELTLDEIEGALRKVRRTLAQLGSVNPFAIEEHRELAERLASVTSQDADLGVAIASTEQLIARLDAEIGSQFNTAFAAIATKFDEFCRLLFAGGSASLQMGDEADGDAAGGIEIAVRPPGKRLQRLAMLSGGERALAGVALLFAMLSVNPVPFCILDEVDAALDEANIGRFAEALRQLSETIDFVVITHNRATIEIADTIYGVTMTDSAVSRLISLRLADLPVEVSVG